MQGAYHHYKLTSEEKKKTHHLQRLPSPVILTINSSQIQVLYVKSS